MNLAFEVRATNEFSAGWMAYVLGLPRPDDDPIAALGWDTGRETSTLDAMRYVMERQLHLEAPQYFVEARDQSP